MVMLFLYALTNIYLLDVVRLLGTEIQLLIHLSGLHYIVEYVKNGFIPVSVIIIAPLVNLQDRCFLTAQWMNKYR